MSFAACHHILALALVALLCCQAAVAVPAAAHAYSLSPPLNYKDELGGPSMVPLGGKLAGGLYQFGPGKGLALPPKALAAPGVWSIEMRVTLNDVTGYKRLIDFSGLQSDNGFYVYYSGLSLYPYVRVSQAVIKPFKSVHVLLTRASNGLVTGYVNGARKLSYNDAATKTFYFAADGVRKPIYLMRDNGSENSAGSMAYVRLYNVALGPADAAALARGVRPPNVKTA